MSGSIQLPLMLGAFVFDDYQLETPESFGDLAGNVSIAQHDFPGGIRTQQQFGYFPAVIRWRGHFSGGLASDRVEQLKRVLAAAAEVELIWGERRWAGLLARFSPTARHTWLFSYEAEFWPRIDLSSGTGESDGSPSPEEILDLQTLALEAWLGPDDAVAFAPVSFVLLDPITALLSVIDTAMAIAQGVIAAISNLARLAIQTAVDVVLTAAAPLLDVLNPLITSPAWDIYSRALVLRNLFQTQIVAKWVIPTVNPNLMLLAAQYYGDATLWRTIADANDLFDPQPIGDFQIIIPAP